jgi:hypothetical protein
MALQALANSGSNRRYGSPIPFDRIPHDPHPPHFQRTLDLRRALHRWPRHFGPGPDVLRVTTIPEEAATEQIRKFTPLASYLEKAVGMKVEFTPVNDYPAAVEALVNKKVDLVWFGGFTHVQANMRGGQDRAAGPARGRHQVPVGVHCQDRLGHQDPAGHEGQADQLRLAKLHQRPPDAAQLPAGRQHQPREGFPPHRLQRRPRRHHRLGGQRQGGRRRARHHRLAQVRERKQGRHQGGGRVLHHAGLLQLQLVGARRHAGRPAGQDQGRAAGTEPDQPGTRRNPAPEPRHPLHRNQARELQGPGNRCAQRRLL